MNPIIAQPAEPARRSTFNGIRPGDRVKFLIPNGRGRNGVEYKESSGRAVLCFPAHVVVNAGGRYGTPRGVDANNYLTHK